MIRRVSKDFSNHYGIRNIRGGSFDTENPKCHQKQCWFLHQCDNQDSKTKSENPKYVSAIPPLNPKLSIENSLSQLR